MKKDDILIEEYRNRQVDFCLPLPEGGWERLEAELSPTPHVSRMIPYRWWMAAAAVLLLAMLVPTIYFVDSADKENGLNGFTLSEFSLPAENASALSVPVLPEKEITYHALVKQEKTPSLLSDGLATLSELLFPAVDNPDTEDSWFYMHVEESYQLIVKNRNQNCYLAENNHYSIPEKKKQERTGWTLGVYAGNMFNRSVAVSDGLRMLNVSSTRSDVHVNNNPSVGTLDDYMQEIASNASNFTTSDEYAMFEKVAAGNYRKPAGTEVRHKFPLTAGVSVKKQVTDRFALESGLVYTCLSSELSAGNESRYVQEQRLHYLGVPIKANYSFWKKDRLSLYASAGGMAELCVDGSLNNMYYLDNIRQYKKKNDLDVDKVQFSVMASLGVQFDVVKPLSIYAEPGIAYYFDDKSEVETIRKEKPFNASVQFGVRVAF